MPSVARLLIATYALRISAGVYWTSVSKPGHRCCYLYVVRACMVMTSYRKFRSNPISTVCAGEIFLTGDPSEKERERFLDGMK